MKYVIYYRVSTKGQGDSGLGLDAQKSYIEHFLNGGDVVGEFTDVMSGGVRERPELNKAIKLCAENGHTLAVAKIDRLSRKTEDALDIFNLLDGRLFSCDIPNLDKFTLTLFMAIADRERELIKIRTKQALAVLKERGVKLGNPQNLTTEGRKKAHESNRRKAAKNENNKRALAMVCEYKKQGMTLQAIADKLNSAGFKSSTGKLFQRTTVSRLVKRCA